MVANQEIIRIKISKIPQGPAPENIRSAWVGLEFPATKFSSPQVEMDFTTREVRPPREAYAVKIDTALEALQTKSPEGVRWFKKNVPLGMPTLTFGADEVEILPNEDVHIG